jgi:formamidopyrimidine-DNA glycosylase
VPSRVYHCHDGRPAAPKRDPAGAGDQKKYWKRPSLAAMTIDLRVYDREGERCPTRGCGGTIRRIHLGGRSTYFCPACQR